MASAAPTRLRSCRCTICLTVLVTGLAPAAASVRDAGVVWACATQKHPQSTIENVTGFIALSDLDWGAALFKHKTPVTAISGNRRAQLNAFTCDSHNRHQTATGESR